MVLDDGPPDTFAEVNTLESHNVCISGDSDGPPIVFAHGYGCDQNMWRFVAPDFESDHLVVLFDYAGSGRATAPYDPVRYSSLSGYADDVLGIIRQLDLHEVTFVGHSVSGMIGVLASLVEPERFSKLVLVGPSPRYINEGDYVGGFAASDIDELLQSLESNYLGWSSAMAPVIMGNADRPELGEELTNSFCRVDPEIARLFAQVTFLSDNRSELSSVSVPTLILQCADDVIAPAAVGEYVHAAIPESTIVYLEAVGHCPNLSAPEETSAAIRSFL
jgi:sigma-B regulation protein RsbQ